MVLRRWTSYDVSVDIGQELYMGPVICISELHPFSKLRGLTRK